MSRNSNPMDLSLWFLVMSKMLCGNTTPQRRLYDRLCYCCTTSCNTNGPRHHFVQPSDRLRQPLQTTNAFVVEHSHTTRTSSTKTLIITPSSFLLLGNCVYLLPEEGCPIPRAVVSTHSQQVCEVSVCLSCQTSFHQFQSKRLQTRALRLLYTGLDFSKMLPPKHSCLYAFVALSALTHHAAAEEGLATKVVKVYVNKKSQIPSFRLFLTYTFSIR